MELKQEQLHDVIRAIYKDKYGIDVGIEGNKIIYRDTFDTYKVDRELIYFKGAAGASKGKKRIDSYL